MSPDSMAADRFRGSGLGIILFAFPVISSPLHARGFLLDPGMAHAEGWIEAYTELEEGRALSAELLSTVRASRNGLGESMLHWYAIEGATEVVESMIGLGFDLNTTNSFGRTPFFECVILNRWEMAGLLLKNGARPEIRDENGEDIFFYLEDYGHKKKLQKLRSLISQGG
jgi:ankyrin repeat protein